MNRKKKMKFGDVLSLTDSDPRAPVASVVHRRAIAHRSARPDRNTGALSVTRCLSWSNARSTKTTAAAAIGRCVREQSICRERMAVKCRFIVAGIKLGALAAGAIVSRNDIPPRLWIIVKDTCQLRDFSLQTREHAYFIVRTPLTYTKRSPRSSLEFLRVPGIGNWVLSRHASFIPRTFGIRART